MRAKFYLHEDSLKNNSGGDRDAYIRKFRVLINDFAFILDDRTEENILIISSSLYDNTDFDGKDIYQFAQEHLKRDDYALLCQILKRGDLKSAYKLSDIESRTHFSKEEKECHVVIKISSSSNKSMDYTKYIEFDKYELVYDKDSWLSVRRQILGNHPGNCDEFMRKAIIYFPSINFSERCKEGLSPYLQQIPRKIVYHLSCMNDHLADFWDAHSNKHAINNICEEFSGKFGFDKAGSQQGDSRTLPGLLCNFEGEKNSLYCPLHFKITSCDSNCTDPVAHRPNFNARIYFQYKDSKIYVGRIGPHI